MPTEDRRQHQDRRKVPSGGRRGCDRFMCPRCQQQGDRIINSRSSDDRTTVRRRHECQTCFFRYSTVERIDQVLASMKGPPYHI